METISLDLPTLFDVNYPTKMKKPKFRNCKAALKRALRVAVATAISCAFVYVTARPEWLALTPALNGLGKYLRDEFEIPYIPF